MRLRAFRFSEECCGEEKDEDIKVSEFDLPTGDKIRDEEEGEDEERESLRGRKKEGQR